MKNPITKLAVLILESDLKRIVLLLRIYRPLSNVETQDHPCLSYGRQEDWHKEN
jgi:hypothetical protein